jgi:hypothetical protein
VNSYTRFSTFIELTDRRQRKWLEDILATIDAIVNDGYDLEDEAERAGFDDRYPDRELCEAILDGGAQEFQVSFTDDGQANLYANEQGDPEQVANFIQAFLRQFQPTATHQFAWVQYTERTVPGGFSGGEILISADDIILQPDYDQLRKLAKQYEAKKRQNPVATIKFNDTAL